MNHDNDLKNDTNDMKDEKDDAKDDGKGVTRRGTAAAARYGKDLVRRRASAADPVVAADASGEPAGAPGEPAGSPTPAAPLPAGPRRGSAGSADPPPPAPSLAERLFGSAGATASPEDEVLLTWRVHLLPRDRRKAVLLFIALAAGLALIWVAFRSWGWLALSTVLVLGSISVYLLPVTYAFTEERVKMTSLLVNESRPWRKFAGYTVFRDAVYLAFDQRTFKGRLLKGYTFYFERNQDEVMAVVRAKMPGPDASP
jgi:hypothetical protein